MTEQALLVLAALAGGEAHGYAIARDVADLSGGAVQLAAGTLYGVLRRLAADGLIAEVREATVDGRRRRYYRLTGAGETALVDAAARLRDTAASIDARVSRGLRPRPA